MPDVLAKSLLHFLGILLLPTYLGSTFGQISFGACERWMAMSISGSFFRLSKDSWLVLPFNGDGFDTSN